MKPSAKLLAALLVVLPVPVVAATSADGRVFHVADPGRIYYQYVTVPTTGLWRFRTSLATGGLDTVIHVWNLTLGHHARSNDDAGFGSCTDLQPTHEKTSCLDLQLSAGTELLVFVRRYNNLRTGACFFRISSASEPHFVEQVLDDVGGDVTFRWGSNQPVSWDAGDTIQAAYAPVIEVTPDSPWQHGLLAPMVLVMAGAEKLVRYSYTGGLGFGDGVSVGDPGIWGQPSVSLPDASAAIVPYPAGSAPYHFVVGQDYYEPSSVDLYGDGRLTYYRNDAAIVGHDSDADNLGDALEDAIGTCKRQQACPESDPKDSDDDGLRDDWETIGGCTFLGCDPESSDAINLAYYGASPTTKDLFVQVDWIDHPSQPVDKWGLLADGLGEIVDVFQAEQTALEVPKNPVHVFFDFGQLTSFTGGAGGNEAPYADYLAVTAGRPECGDMEQCGTSCSDVTVGGTVHHRICEPYAPTGDNRCLMTCAGGCPWDLECLAGRCLPKSPTACTDTSDCDGDHGEACVLDGAGGHVCRSAYCRREWAPCIAEDPYPPCLGSFPSCDPDEPSTCTGTGYSCVLDDDWMVPDFDEDYICVPSECASQCNRSIEMHQPYNLQRIVRGDPSDSFSYLPLNRRGLFTEVWLGLGLHYSESFPYGYLATTQYATGTAPSGQEARKVWPGFIQAGDIGNLPFSGAPASSTDWTATLFHELGHIVGLQDGVVEFVPQASCHWDSDCYPGWCVGNQCADVTQQYVPNHISNMNYYFDRVDAAGHLDYSSGLHEAIEPFRVAASSCEDPECPSYGTPACSLPPGLQPPGGKCCLVGRRQNSVAKKLHGTSVGCTSSPGVGLPGEVECRSSRAS